MNARLTNYVMTVKLVDDRDRAMATFSTAAALDGAERTGRGYLTRWNERADTAGSERAHGFYVWDETGRMLAYG